MKKNKAIVYLILKLNNFRLSDIKKYKVVFFLMLNGAFFPTFALAQGAAGGKLLDIIGRLSGYAMQVLIGVGLLFLVLAGFKFVFARGDESKLASARSMLLWSIIGIMVGALAPSLLDMAQSLFQGSGEEFQDYPGGN
jgi:tellurite resistance protein TehA-like permease